MNLKRIAASAASFILLFGMCGFSIYDGSDNYAPFTAYADEYDNDDYDYDDDEYDFDFVDEYDYDLEDEDIEIDEIELNDSGDNEINVNADISDNAAVPRKRRHNVVSSFVISLLIGLVSALIVVSIMKSSMKSVHKKTGATDYRKENSFKLEKNTDTFLYKRVEKTAKPKTNPTNNK
jgi:hypothetical protein